MPDVADAASGVRRRRPVWPWVVVGAFGAIVGVAALNAAPTVDPSEPTAEASRDELNLSLVQAADAAGLDASITDDATGPWTCDRHDGHEGTSYLLQEVTASPPNDPEAALRAVRSFWQEQGYDVSDITLGDARGLSAITPHGGSLQFFVGVRAANFGGETVCSLTNDEPKG